MECTKVKEYCVLLFFNFLLLFSSLRSPVASLCPSTVTPLASDAAFHCNDIPPSQNRKRSDRERLQVLRYPAK